MKTLTLLIILVLMGSISEAGQITFDLKKSVFSDKHSLIIENQDKKRTISFSGCLSEMPIETDYYVLMNNGSKHYLDSEIFCQIGIKGRYWINAGNKGNIPFIIKKEILQNAQSIVFKGVTFIPIKTGSFIDSKDMREINIIYNIKDGRASIDKVIENLGNSGINKDFLDNLVEQNSSHKYSVSSDELSEVGIETEDFRLRTKMTNKIE